MEIDSCLPVCRSMFSSSQSAVQCICIVRQSRHSILVSKAWHEQGWFCSLHSLVSPSSRKIKRILTVVTCWSSQVCEEEKCQDEVFPLAINIMDRYLSQVAIRKKELQLLGTVSLFLSSKLRQTVALDADKLVNYTDNSITSEDLLVSCFFKVISKEFFTKFIPFLTELGDASLDSTEMGFVGNHSQWLCQPFTSSARKWWCFCQEQRSCHQTPHTDPDQLLCCRWVYLHLLWFSRHSIFPQMICCIPLCESCLSYLLSLDSWSLICTQRGSLCCKMHSLRSSKSHSRDNSIYSSISKSR